MDRSHRTRLIVEAAIALFAVLIASFILAAAHIHWRSSWMASMLQTAILVGMAAFIVVWRWRTASDKDNRDGWRSGRATFMAAIALLTLGTIPAASTVTVMREQSERIVHAKLDRSFEFAVERLQDAMLHQEQSLRGIRAAYAASTHIDPHEQRILLQHGASVGSELVHSSIGLITPVDASHLPEFVAQQRADLGQEFSVDTQGGSERLFIISRVADATRDAGLLGKDMNAAPAVRSVLERAINSNECVISDPITIPDRDGTRRALLIALQLSTSAPSTASDGQRRPELSGIAFRLIDLSSIRDLLNRTSDGTLDFAIRDLQPHTAPAPILDASHTDPSHLTMAGARARIIPAADRSWQIVAGPTAAFLSRVDTPLEDVVGVIGALLSAMVALTYWLLATSRNRARAAAISATNDLRRLAMVAERTINGVIIADARGRVVWVNEGFTRMTGYTLADIAGRTPGSVLRCERSDPLESIRMSAAVRAGQPCVAELYNRSKSGREYIVSIEIQPILDDNRSIRGFIAVETDVTDRRAAQVALAESEARFRTIADAVPMLVWISGPDKLCTDFNRAWLQFTGRTLEQELGLGWIEGVHPDDREQCLASYDSAFEARRPFRLTYRLRRHDGEYRYLEDHGAPRFAADGTFLGYAGGCLDITDQVRHAEILKEHADRLDLTVHAARLGTWDWHIPSDRAVFSELWTQMLGYRGDELDQSGSTWRSLVHPDDLPAAAERLEAHMRGDTPEFRAEIRMRRKDGSYLYVLTVGRVILRGPANEPLRMVGIHMDVHEARLTAQALELAKTNAEAAVRAKSQFLANMSHEIRTPMASILGYTELLSETDGVQLSPAERAAHVATIRRNGEHLLSIINDILDLSKIESGRLSVELLNIPPLQIVRDVESLLHNTAQSKGIALNVECRTPIPATILTDPVRFKQILLNLVGNAVKFTSSGAVTIAIRLDKDSPSPTLCVDVTDTGIGIDPEFLPKLFHAFSQADSSMTRRFGGSGLGLRICHLLADLLGGAITVRSTPGVGSTFTLHLPTGALSGVPMLEPASPSVAGAKPAEPTSRRTQEAPLAGVRIFFAEDGIDNQRLVAHLLRRAGAEVTIFDNGLAALNALVDRSRVDRPLLDPLPCDLLITDMQMPELDGYGLARLLRVKSSNLPILALTAHAMVDDARRCIDAGCDAYLSKPVARDALIRACLQTLERRSVAVGMT